MHKIRLFDNRNRYIRKNSLGKKFKCGKKFDQKKIVSRKRYKKSITIKSGAFLNIIVVDSISSYSGLDI